MFSVALSILQRMKDMIHRFLNGGTGKIENRKLEKEILFLNLPHASKYINKNSDIMANAPGQYKKMPDAVEVAYFFVKGVKAGTRCI